jgi:hypothetical protein
MGYRYRFKTCPGKFIRGMDLRLGQQNRLDFELQRYAVRKLLVDKEWR